MKSRILCAAILTGLFLAPFALSQPAPEPTPPPPPPPLWEGKLGLGYAATGGNSSTSTLTTGFEVYYRPLPWTIRAKFDYLRASSEGVLTAETLTALAAGIRDLNEVLDVFVQAGYERNVFSGIDSRIGGEAGAGFKLLRGPEVFFRPEVAFGYRHENRTDDTTLDYPAGRAGFKFVWKFSKSAD